MKDLHIERERKEALRIKLIEDRLLIVKKLETLELALAALGDQLKVIDKELFPDDECESCQ